MATMTADDIRALLKKTKTIAVVGASSNPDRPSNSIMRMLQSVGYRCIPINPNEDEVLGEKTFPSLADVPEKIDIVNVFRRPAQTPEVAQEAVRIGAGALWLQSGIRNAEAEKIAADNNLTFVQDQCIAVLYRTLRVAS